MDPNKEQQTPHTRLIRRSAGLPGFRGEDSCASALNKTPETERRLGKDKKMLRGGEGGEKQTNKQAEDETAEANINREDLPLQQRNGTKRNRNRNRIRGLVDGGLRASSRQLSSGTPPPKSCGFCRVSCVVRRASCVPIAVVSSRRTGAFSIPSAALHFPRPAYLGSGKKTMTMTARASITINLPHARKRG